jgi:hypothetical protein
MKAGPAVTAGVILGVIGGIASLTNLSSPSIHKDSQAATVIAQQQTDDDPLAGVREWDSYLEGNKIACYASKTARWYIALPTPEQRADGEVMVVNKSPSDDAWSLACSKQPVMGQW